MTKTATMEEGNGSGQPSDPEGQPTTEEGQGTPQTDDPPSSTTPSGEQGNDGGTQSPFTHPRLAGRSPQEIERLVSTMEATVHEQKRTLDEVYDRASKAPAPSEPTPSAKPTDKDFWNDPVGTMEKVIEGHLDRAIAPFRQNLAEGRAASAYDQMRAEFSDWDDYAPMIETIRQKHGIESPSADNLRSLYYLAVGYAARNQGAAPSSPQPSEPVNQPSRQPNPAPPQNRASSQPLPTPSKPAKRPLTENERRLMREWGMTEEQFRENQDSDPMEME